MCLNDSDGRDQETEDNIIIRLTRFQVDCIGHTKLIGLLGLKTDCPLIRPEALLCV